MSDSEKPTLPVWRPMEQYVFVMSNEDEDDLNKKIKEGGWHVVSITPFSGSSKPWAFVAVLLTREARP